MYTNEFRAMVNNGFNRLESYKVWVEESKNLKDGAKEFKVMMHWIAKDGLKDGNKPVFIISLEDLKVMIQGCKNPNPDSKAVLEEAKKAAAEAAKKAAEIAAKAATAAKVKKPVKGTPTETTIEDLDDLETFANMTQSQLVALVKKLQAK